VRAPLLIAWLALAALAFAPAASAATDPVDRVLDGIEAGGQVDPVVVDAWQRDWRDARIAARRLSGTPKAHLAGVVANTRSLARRGLLVERVKPALLIVQRNVEFFWRDRLAAPASDTRRAFPGSDVVFQLVAGSGWQLHPLANLGTLNALSKRRRITERTRAWADDLLELAVRRRGVLALEYLFPFSGGPPGWASAMPQAVALETYARLGRRAEAREMLELFRQVPPSGVRVVTEPGRAHYLMYPQAPRLMIGNGFAQAVLSLHAYAALEPDYGPAQEAFAVALAEARAGLALYDTGAWSLYYHEPGSARGGRVRPALPPALPRVPRADVRPDRRRAVLLAGRELRRVRDRAGPLRHAAVRRDQAAARGSRLRLQALLDPRDALPRRGRDRRRHARGAARDVQRHVRPPARGRPLPHRPHRDRAHGPAQRDRGLAADAHASLRAAMPRSIPASPTAP
jgi:hypothetical protein